MIWAPCDKSCEPRDQYACRGEERAHEFVLQDGGEGNEIVEARCGNCGNLAVFLKEDWDHYGKQMELRAQRSGNSRANLTKYPRIEPHTGALVNSRDDEVRAMRAYGMHPAENGIDERYDDESCEILRDKRQKIQAKKLEIERRRKALNRPQIIRKAQ